MDWFLAEDWNLLFPGSNWSQILIFLQSSWFCSYMHHVRIDWSEPTIMVSHIICIYLDRCLAIHTPFCFGLLFGETPRIRHWFLEQDQQTPPKNFDCFKANSVQWTSMNQWLYYEFQHILVLLKLAKSLPKMFMVSSESRLGDAAGQSGGECNLPGSPWTNGPMAANANKADMGMGEHLLLPYFMGH